MTIIMSLLAVLIASLAIVLFRKREERAFLRGRTPVSIAELNIKLSREVGNTSLEDVLAAIGSGYSINPRLIRPEDQIKTFAKMDSWLLGRGEERLSEWLRVQGVSEQFNESATVLDIVQAVDRARLDR